MWIFSFIPDSYLQYAIFGLILFGVFLYLIGTFTSLIPPLKPYAEICKGISIFIILAGSYFLGGYGTEMEWRNRVAALEEKVAKADIQSKQANDKLDKKAQQQVKIIREKGIVVKQYIDREVVKYDTKFAPGGQCEIPKEFIKAHNDSAEQTK
jgi:hypothetical protein